MSLETGETLTLKPKPGSKKPRFNITVLRGANSWFKKNVGWKPTPGDFQGYVEAMSDKQLATMLEAVLPYTKGFYNGDPEDRLYGPVLKALQDKHYQRDDDGKVLYPNDFNENIMRTARHYEDLIRDIEKAGWLLRDGTAKYLSGDTKLNEKLLRKKIYSCYKNIMQIPKNYSGELADSWVDCVDIAAVHLMHFTGDSDDRFDVRHRLEREIEKRRPKTDEELAEIQRIKDQEWDLEEQAEDEWLEQPYYIRDLADAEEANEQLTKQNYAYQFIMEEIREILNSNQSAAKRAEALEIFVSTLDAYQQSSDEDVSQHLKKFKNWRYTNGVFKLNGIPNIKGKKFKPLFKPYKYDGFHRNGHSKQMLALRFGIETDYYDTKSLEITVVKRRNNKGNDVDCEIHYGDGETEQIITSLEVDNKDNFVFGTFKSFYQSYWVKAEEMVLPNDYKTAERPIEWFLQQHPKVKAKAAALMQPKNENKASA